MASHSHHLVWLVPLDVCWALSTDSLSYGRHSAQGLASVCTSVPVCFPSSPLGAELGCECGGCSFLQVPLPSLAPSS
jgi:hypothetical protein